MGLVPRPLVSSLYSWQLFVVFSWRARRTRVSCDVFRSVVCLDHTNILSYFKLDRSTQLTDAVFTRCNCVVGRRSTSNANVVLHWNTVITDSQSHRQAPYTICTTNRQYNVKLNQGSFVLLCFALFDFWIVFSLCIVCIFNLSSTNMNGTV